MLLARSIGIGSSSSSSSSSSKLDNSSFLAYGEWPRRINRKAGISFRRCGPEASSQAEWEKKEETARDSTSLWPPRGITSHWWRRGSLSWSVSDCRDVSDSWSRGPRIELTSSHAPLYLLTSLRRSVLSSLSFSLLSSSFHLVQYSST